MFPAPQNDYVSDFRRDSSANLIHIGTNPLHVRIGGDRHDAHPRRYHYRPFGSCYRPGHHYYGYRPLYYPGYVWYRPNWGYSYSTVYLSEPYYVQTYDYSDPVVYYPETSSSGTSTVTSTVEAVAPTQSAPAGGTFPQPTSESYEPLTASPQASMVEEGNTAFAAGRYLEAQRAYLRAVMADERDGYAKALLSWTSFAMGDFSSAAATLRRALLTTSELLQYPMDLRTMYTDPAALTHQIDALAQFVQTRPDDREAEFVLAYAYYSIGEAQRAADMFNSLAQRDTKDTLAAELRDAALRAASGQLASPPQP